MPCFYPEDEYDLAGFAVGIVDEAKLITGADIKAGDVLVGIASSGVHSNGFSLVRKVFTMTETNLSRYVEALGTSLGEALLVPTKIYVKALKSVRNAGVPIKGCSHITGGGFYENIPRMFPEGIGAKISKASYKVPAIFEMIKRDGKIAEEMMYNTYNMGIGMILAVDNSRADDAVKAIEAAGEKAFIIGETVASDKKEIVLC